MEPPLSPCVSRSEGKISVPGNGAVAMMVSPWSTPSSAETGIHPGPRFTQIAPCITAPRVTHRLEVLCLSPLLRTAVLR